MSFASSMAGDPNCGDCRGVGWLEDGQGFLARVGAPVTELSADDPPEPDEREFMGRRFRVGPAPPMGRVSKCRCHGLVAAEALATHRAKDLPDGMSWASWRDDRTKLSIAGRSTLFTRLAQWAPVGCATAPFIFGAKGTGKTHALIALTRSLIGTEGVAALYVNLTLLFDRERDAIKHGTIPRPMESAMEAPVLLVDDIGASRPPTAWELERLYLLTDTRLMRGLPTIWASNFDGPQLRAWLQRGEDSALADRVLDRIKRGTGDVYRFEAR